MKLKALFILGRTRRSISTLDAELTELEDQLGLSNEDAMMSGDLVLWSVIGERIDGRYTAYDPVSFWQAHAATFRSETLSEYVIGEFGRNILSASETDYVDEHDGRRYAYGNGEQNDDKGEVLEPEPRDDDEDDDWNFGPPHRDPYSGRVFQSVCVQEWFDDRLGKEDVPSFGRKLLIIIGRDRERRFLESRTGQRLRAALGLKARVVLNAQGADAAAIAFESPLTPNELFSQIRRLLPPRWIEDFLILEIGMKYCTGEQPISVFAEWDAAQRNRSRGVKRKFASDGARTTSSVSERTEPASGLGHRDRLAYRATK